MFRGHRLAVIVARHAGDADCRPRGISAGDSSAMVVLMKAEWKMLDGPARYARWGTSTTPPRWRVCTGTLSSRRISCTGAACLRVLRGRLAPPVDTGCTSPRDRTSFSILVTKAGHVEGRRERRRDGLSEGEAFGRRCARPLAIRSDACRVVPHDRIHVEPHSEPRAAPTREQPLSATRS
jgi:hypothetical protein